MGTGFPHPVSPPSLPASQPPEGGHLCPEVRDKRRLRGALFATGTPPNGRSTAGRASVSACWGNWREAPLTGGFTGTFCLMDTSLPLSFRKIQEEEGFTDILCVQATCAQPHVSVPQFLLWLGLERLPGGSKQWGVCPLRTEPGGRGGCGHVCSVSLPAPVPGTAGTQ